MVERKRDKFLILRVQKDFHREIKSFCAASDLSITDFVESTLKEKIAANK
jgi:predicted HicB family RNase H-like nuclease